MKSLDDISTAEQEIKTWLGSVKPQMAIVLGSGLSSLLAHLQHKKTLSYEKLTGFPSTGVEGHTGCVFCGELFGLKVLIFQGRYHCYEGYDAWQVTAPVRLAAAVGCHHLLLTNAAGGLLDDMSPGDFMLVDDHLNFTGKNPLAGRQERQFLDLNRLYEQSFYSELREQLRRQHVKLHKGTLAWMLGPTYETPAEIKALECFGAAAVSMSTIPEAIVAKRFGLSVVTISFISNLAAGKSVKGLNHDDVLNLGHRMGRDFSLVVEKIIAIWSPAFV